MPNKNEGPWQRAKRVQAEEEFLHAHDNPDPDIGTIAHVHEYQNLNHEHPGFGPGYLLNDGI